MTDQAPLVMAVWWWSWSAGLRCTRRGRQGDRWRAVWYENGRRRQCEAVTEEKLAAKLVKVTERLAAEAPTWSGPART